MKKLIALIAIVLTFTACKKDNADPVTPNPTPAPTADVYTQRCGVVLTCEIALPESHPAYYKMLVDYGNGVREIKYWNRPFVKGQTFCYWALHYTAGWGKVEKIQSEICGTVAGYMPVGAINYGWNVIVNYPQLGTKKVYYTQGYYPLGSTFCANP